MGEDNLAIVDLPEPSKRVAVVFALDFIRANG